MYKQFKQVLIGGIVATALLTTCSSVFADTKPVDPANACDCNSLTKPQENKCESYTITLKKGVSLTKKLKCNPSTGYVWSIQEPGDSSIIETTLVYKKNDNVIWHIGGTIVSYVYQFKAIDVGTTKVKLILSRPFENKVPLITHDITVNVIE